MKVTGILSKIVTMSDRTLRVSFDLNEVTPPTGAQLLEYLQNYVNIAVIPGEAEFKEEELDFPKIAAPAGKEITWSQKLRNVFYRLWEADSQGFSSFNDYYGAKMKQLIEHYKGRLDELK